METEKRLLQCRLTDEEIARLGETLAEKEIGKTLEEADAKAAASASRKRIKELRVEISESAKAIDTGVQEREVECRHVRRLDTGEVEVRRTDFPDWETAKEAVVERRTLRADERQAQMFADGKAAEAKEKAAADPKAAADAAKADGRVQQWSPKDGAAEGQDLARQVFGDAAAPTKPDPEGVVPDDYKPEGDTVPPWNGSLVGLDAGGKEYTLDEEQAREIARGGSVTVTVDHVTGEMADIVLLKPPPEQKKTRRGRTKKAPVAIGEGDAVTSGPHVPAE